MATEEMDLVNHMRELAEDLHSIYGNTELGTALSKGADEIERLRAEINNHDG